MSARACRRRPVRRVRLPRSRALMSVCSAWARTRAAVRQRIAWVGVRPGGGWSAPVMVLWWSRAGAAVAVAARMGPRAVWCRRVECGICSSLERVNRAPGGRRRVGSQVSGWPARAHGGAFVLGAGYHTVVQTFDLEAASVPLCRRQSTPRSCASAGRSERGCGRSANAPSCRRSRSRSWWRWTGRRSRARRTAGIRTTSTSSSAWLTPSVSHCIGCSPMTGTSKRAVIDRKRIVGHNGW